MSILVLLSTLATVLAGRFASVGEVNTQDAFVAIESHQEKYSDIAALHEEVRRALMEESIETVQDTVNMQERYKELKNLRSQVERIVAHCQDEVCVIEEQERYFDHLRKIGKLKGKAPIFTDLIRPRETNLREFPPIEEEFEPQPPLVQFQPTPEVDDEDDFSDEYEDFGTDESNADFIDEFAYDNPKRRNNRYPSTKDIEEQIRQQVKAQLMEAAIEMQAKAKFRGDEAPTTTVCVPDTTICDFNIVLGLVWTALVSVVVSVLNQQPRKATHVEKKSKKKQN